jgi:lipopolysaccharide biosynthesis regulator YciM
MFMVIEHKFLTKDASHTLTNNTFVADSGATCHMRGSLEGVHNLKAYFTDIMVGNNDTISSVSKSHYKVLVMLKDGTSLAIVLQDVLHIQKRMVNLFTLTKSIETKGDTLSSRGQMISMTLGNTKIFLYIVFSQRLLVLEIHPTSNHIASTAQTLDMNVVHEMFGHLNSQALPATAAKCGFKTKNDLYVCSNCAIRRT